MKVYQVLLASALAAAALGTGISWVSFGHAPAQLLPLADRAPGIERTDSPPKLVVDSRYHDFGFVELGSTVRHAFQVTNAGQGTLTLKAGTTTCTACTIAKLDRTEVPPGETAEVLVEYQTERTRPKFYQTATILTNDPEQPRVELKIGGTLISKYEVLPPEISFGNVPVHESATAEVNVVCYLADDVRVADYAFIDAGSAGHYDVRFDPLSTGELSDPEAESGVRVVLSLKPGLPLGPFRQTIRLTLEAGPDDDRSELSLPIGGIIVSDLWIVGPGWRGEAGLLSLGRVKSAEGATRNLRILARGEARGKVEIEPLQLDPPWLRVSLGEPTRLNDAVDQIPLVIEIPPGAPPSVHLGNEQGAFGSIVLGVKNYPDVQEMRLRLRFMVSN